MEDGTRRQLSRWKEDGAQEMEKIKKMRNEMCKVLQRKQSLMREY
jgi:hypothetical protein